ncbi:hypothetical protein RclHR1_10270001 [Rhizophagus clarus]|uniref:Uncharacterized protein n=1 Tax=Rhizophagus clarus TaxID=94130 RepID=A0A2Z6Q156_9GLOM|nr:hypothetical protein RclHR1_10270001 [Rhizophagus clarus]
MNHYTTQLLVTLSSSLTLIDPILSLKVSPSGKLISSQTHTDSPVHPILVNNFTQSSFWVKTEATLCPTSSGISVHSSVITVKVCDGPVKSSSSKSVTLTKSGKSGFWG